VAGIVSGVFTRPVFGPDKGAADRQKAATGFTQIFTSMVAKQMRQALTGSNKGPLGTSGGASGEIYGAFFDQALGKTLAGSRAMAPMRKMVARSLGRPSAKESALAKETYPQGAVVRANSAGDLLNVIDTVSGTSGVARLLRQSETVELQSVQPGDNRGPQLLPPAPSQMAPLLPPPKS
jgi:Rod binding domain-containing protein